MSTLLFVAVILFTIAMALYSISVWAEFRSKYLKPWHVWMFLSGVVVDVLATALTYKAVGGLVFTLHAIMGFISLGLMIIHLIWATVTIIQNTPATLARFHKFSIFVWSMWMISYVSGFALGMDKIV